jgi:hypothetical protein
MYTIKSSGWFTIPDLAPEGRCGAKGNAFAYHVEVGVRDLDENRFVFDGDLVPTAFAKFLTGRWRASCEDVAGGVVYIFVRQITQGRAERVSVTIHPNTERSLTIEWNKGDDMPATYPTRVDAQGRPLPKPAPRPSLRRAVARAS